jgi:hypothetical protein
MSLPTARSTQSNGCTLQIWCHGCRRAVPVDLQRLIDDGRGDVPLIELRWRCSVCDTDGFGLIVGSKRTGPTWNRGTASVPSGGNCGSDRAVSR